MRASLVVVCFLGVLAEVRSQQHNDTDDSAREIKNLINRLTELRGEDTIQFGSGKSGAMGVKFLPFLKWDYSYWGQRDFKPNERTLAFIALVKQGPKAIPLLLEHLKDDRPTRIEFEGFGFFATLDLEKPQDEKRLEERSYTVTVGDMCIAALGQIVNRPYSPFHSWGLGGISITPVSKTQKLRDQLNKLWGGMTPEKHRDSLLKDIESGDDDAYMRLAFFHPIAFESVALKQLSKETYDSGLVETLIREKLYPAKSAKERMELVDTFVKEHGKLHREGIRWMLFLDLDQQERDEAGISSVPSNPPKQARECLMDIFDYPLTVKSKQDRPKVQPTRYRDQNKFIESLQYDESAKVNKKVHEMLANAKDPHRVLSCIDRLTGRGYDREIEVALDRFPEFKTEDYKDTVQKIKSQLGYTRLHVAASLGIRELVERAIKNRIPVNTQAKNGRTALHLAADEGAVELVELLLNAKANPNISDSNGQLSVDLAAKHANPYIPDIDGQTPSENASQLRYHNLVRELVLVHGSNVSDLFTALIAGTGPQIRSILNTNPKCMNDVNQFGMTPLHVAVTRENFPFVRDLIRAGANRIATVAPHIEGQRHGESALHLSVKNRDTRIAKFLLDSGIDVDTLDPCESQTPLHMAAEHGNVNLVKLLLERKANVSICDNDGRTALDLARKYEQHEVVKLLENAK